MKKILVITHKVDIDGHGGVILANLAFKKENVDYILAMPVNIDEIVESVDTEKYSKIYITDICPSDKVLSKIDEDKKLKAKIKIFDHHLPKQSTFKKDYDFVTMLFKKEDRKVCGTSLFYEYLLSNNLLKEKESITNLVELTRRYDTWEWKEKYNDVNPNKLTIFMEILGYDLYISYMTDKLLQNEKFNFTAFENNLIASKEKEIERYVKEATNNLFVISIDEYKVAVCFAENFRNDIKEYVKKNNLVDADLLAIIKVKDKNISYRSLKENVDVNKFAQKYGGGGIFAAAGSQFKIDELKKMANILF